MRAQRSQADLATVRTLIAEAYEKFGASCLDNIAIPAKSAGLRGARAVADALMTRGGKDAFLLGRRILERAKT